VQPDQSLVSVNWPVTMIFYRLHEASYKVQQYISVTDTCPENISTFQHSFTLDDLEAKLFPEHLSHNCKLKAHMDIIS